MAAMESRPASSVASMILEPCPTVPKRFSFGTRQSSKNNSAVSEARHIILLCMAARLKPGVSLSTITVVKVLLPSGMVETACTVQPILMSEAPFVIKILEPLITHSSPANSTVVLEALESDPAPGSVRPKLQSASPVQSCGRYFFR